MSLAITELKRITTLIDEGHIISGLLTAKNSMKESSLLYFALEKRAKTKSQELGIPKIEAALERLSLNDPDSYELLRIEREELSLFRTEEIKLTLLPQRTQFRNYNRRRAMKGSKSALRIRSSYRFAINA
jgi:hypothetical protein